MTSSILTGIIMFGGKTGCGKDYIKQWDVAGRGDETGRKLSESIRGKLEFKVLYMADEMVPVPASLEGRIPFEEMIYLEQEPEGNLVLQTSDTEVTVTMIHSRKLNIKTLAEISIGTEKVYR